MKITDKSRQQDPFQHLQQFPENILQHLTAPELVNLSMVSPKISQIISHSTKSMSKIKFVYRERLELFPKSLQKAADPWNCQRNYQHMCIWLNHPTNAKQKFSLLSRNASSLVDLELGITSKELLNAVPGDMSFPNLESLKINNAENLIERCFTNVTSLKKVLLPVMLGNHIHDEVKFFQWLKQQHNLEELELICVREFPFFVNLLDDAPFKLTSLTWHNFEDENFPLSMDARCNFNKFLRKMSTTLTTLEMALAYPEDLEIIVNNLPALTSLRLKKLAGNLHRTRLNPNQCITTLNVATNYWPAPSLPRYLLMPLLKLEALQIDIITRIDLVWISQNLLNLKSLIYSSTFTETPKLRLVRDFYKDLVHSGEAINAHIDIVQQ